MTVRRTPAGRGPARRAVIGTGLALATASLAGCLGLFTREFAATPVVLPPATRRRLNYHELADRSLPLEVNAGVAGATVRSHLAAYGPADVAGGDPLDRPALVALATPDAVVGGRSLNPLVDAPLSELVSGELVGRVVDAADVLVGERDGPPSPGGLGLPAWETRPRPVPHASPPVGRVLGLDATVESYAGLAGGAEPQVVVLHLLRVKPDDVVLAAGVHAVSEASAAISDDSAMDAGTDRDPAATPGPARPLVGDDGYVTTARVGAGAAETARLARRLERRVA